MSQSTVTVRINGQPYQMGCDVGQESHIEEMGHNVDAVSYTHLTLPTILLV